MNPDNSSAAAAVTNPHPSTGPRTETGKERSSRNATKNGLFAARDFVRDGESEEYTKTLASLMRDLAPESILEETFASEIMTATWRLRRCRIVEADLAGRLDLSPAFDLTPEEIISKEQKSIDRARAQSHSVLRRSIAELRKQQTERSLRIHLPHLHVSGLTDIKQVVSTLAMNDKQRIAARKADGLDTLQGIIAKSDEDVCMQMRAHRAESLKTDLPGLIPEESVAQTQGPGQAPTLIPEESVAQTQGPGQAPTLIPEESLAQTHSPGQKSSFCKPAQTAAAAPKTTPRNAHCNCNSGLKFKRCCGKNGPPVLSPVLSMAA